MSSSQFLALHVDVACHPCGPTIDTILQDGTCISLKQLLLLQIVQPGFGTPDDVFAVAQ